MSTPIVRPTVGQNVYIAPTAYVGGNVTIGDETTIMHHVTVRGDVSEIIIGKRVSIQDGTVIHTQKGVPLYIADEVAIGHRAVVHCHKIGRGSLIGVGSIVLDGCEIGAGCIVGAAALVTPGTIIPDGKLVVGVPARITRDVEERDLKYMRRVVNDYVKMGRAHANGQYPNHVRTEPRA